MPNGFKPFCDTSARKGSELSRIGDNLDGTLSTHDPESGSLTVPHRPVALPWPSAHGRAPMAERPWPSAHGPWPMSRGWPMSRDLSVMGLWVMSHELWKDHGS